MYKETASRQSGEFPKLDLEDDLRNFLGSMTQTEGVQHALNMLSEKRLSGAKHVIEVELIKLNEGDPKFEEAQRLIKQIKDIIE